MDVFGSTIEEHVVSEVLVNSQQSSHFAVWRQIDGLFSLPTTCFFWILAALMACNNYHVELYSRLRHFK